MSFELTNLFFFFQVVELLPEMQKSRRPKSHESRGHFPLGAFKVTPPSSSDLLARTPSGCNERSEVTQSHTLATCGPFRDGVDNEVDRSG